MTIKKLKFCNQYLHDTSKTSTMANRTDFPIKHYLSVTCFCDNETESRVFIKFFCRSYIKPYVLGTPFLGDIFKAITFKSFSPIPSILSVIYQQLLFLIQYKKKNISLDFNYLSKRFKKKHFFKTQHCTIFATSTEKKQIFTARNYKY